MWKRYWPYIVFTPIGCFIGWLLTQWIGQPHIARQGEFVLEGNTVMMVTTLIALLLMPVIGYKLESKVESRRVRIEALEASGRVRRRD